MIKPVLHAICFHVPYWKGEANADTQGMQRSYPQNLLHDKRNLMLFQRVTLAVQIIFTIGLGIALVVAPAPFLYAVALGFAGCAVVGTICNITSEIWDIATWERSINDQKGRAIADLTGRIMGVFFSARILLAGIAAIGGTIAFAPYLATLWIVGGTCTALGAWLTYSTAKEVFEKYRPNLATV